MKSSLQLRVHIWIASDNKIITQQTLNSTVHFSCDLSPHINYSYIIVHRCYVNIISEH